MSTQIYVQPPVTPPACQPEYTKIASHSFGFQPTGLPLNPKTYLYTGGNVNITDLYVFPTWSAQVRDYAERYEAGALTGEILSEEAATGIPIPINLVADDVVTISGNASYNNATAYINNGYDVNLIVGVYYFNCNEVDSSTGASIYTFIPVSTVAFDKSDKVCFDASVKLGSNYDIHDTRLLVGYNIVVTCPISDVCDPPVVNAELSTVSYTLDIERPCKVEITNFIIRNCCVPIITELVHIPGLVVGDFHVDDEGNCWEVMEGSTSVTNFTRNFVDIYTSCLECQTANPCPANLIINSCCVEGNEFVTGSLPGLNVGDTFVDNYGLCWSVNAETSAPISEESITIDHIIPTGNCATCLEENECPNFYQVVACCTSTSGIIAIPAITIINVGDSFVDTNGICWQVTGTAATLPTMYGVVVDTIYPYDPENDACATCSLANPCPTEYFITIRGCCDPQRIEVAQVPAEFMTLGEGTIFNDWWGVCWEVMSVSTTGVETYPIWDNVNPEAPSPKFGNYKECRDCSCANSGCKCKTFYEVRNCNTNEISIFKMQDNLTIGLYYRNHLDGDCYEVLGYGYPAFNESPVAFNAETKWPDFTTCEECIIGTPAQKVVELQPCCGGPNIIAQINGPWINGIGTVQMVTLQPAIGPIFTTNFCYTLIGLSTDTPAHLGGTFSGLEYSDCPACTDQYPCE
jgi:hypothetical protein